MKKMSVKFTATVLNW